MKGYARIIWNEHYRERKKKQPGKRVKMFRRELRRQGLKFTEIHYPAGRRFKNLHLSCPYPAEIVIFRW